MSRKLINEIMKKIFTFALMLFIQLVTNSSFAQIPNWQWAKSEGRVNASDYYNDICTDENGNTYITGNFNTATITFGSTTLTNNSSGAKSDFFIVKYNISGNLVWAISAGGTDRDCAYGICVDNNENVYLTGYFQSPTITFGATILTRKSFGTDVFVVKYDANGNAVWSKNHGQQANDSGKSICVDTAGNCYVAGGFTSSSIDFGETTLTCSGYNDMFIAKYDAFGNVIWAIKQGGALNEDVRGIDIDAAGNIYVTEVSQQNDATTDIMTLKYDASGSYVQGNIITGAKNEECSGICADAAGNYYVTGSFKSLTITIGTLTLTNTNTNFSTDFFIVKYDAAGNVAWAKNAAGTGNDYGKSISVDASGNTYLTGTFQSSIIFDTTTLPISGSSNVFVAKYDASGNLTWVINPEGFGYCYKISTLASGDSFLTGCFSGPFSFGSITLTETEITVENSNFFIAKLGNATGIVNMQNNSSNLTIYPNPAQNQLTIETELNAKQKFDIVNIMGQIVYTSTIEKTTTIDLSQFSNGVYMIKIESEKLNIIQKFVKQ